MRERSVVVWLILGTALLVALNLPDAWSERGKGVVRDVLSPLQALVSGLQYRSAQWGSAVRGLGEMALENQQLSAEITRLRSEIRYLEALEAENVALRAQLGFLSRPHYRLIPAEVIGRDISGWWQTVRIGKGLAEGIESDMAVVTPDGLVGRTRSVSAGTADILLISDPSSKVSAYLPRVDAHGILSGRGVTPRGVAMLQMEFINKDARVREGDEVVSSGLGGTYPKGLLIGYIEQVSLDDSGLFQRAQIRPAADLGRLLYCFVVSESRDPVEALLRQAPVNGGGTEP